MVNNNDFKYHQLFHYHSRTDMSDKFEQSSAVIFSSVKPYLFDHMVATG